MKINEAVFNQALHALDDLHFSRTGTRFPPLESITSEAEKRSVLKERIMTEKLLRTFREVLHTRMRLVHGDSYSFNMRELNPDTIAEAVVEAAGYFLANQELEALRIRIARSETGAYYNINTNERLPSDEADLFSAIQQMERRIIVDSNLPLPETIDPKHAFILGQTLDHEGDFWLRAQIKRGNENVFSFGVINFQSCFPCVEIRRLRKEVVAEIIRRKTKIPTPEQHYSSISRSDELLLIVQRFLGGKELLNKELQHLRPLCLGSYELSKFAARACAALLLHETGPGMKSKVDEEWGKLFQNHPNVLGDTLLIHNALYFNADILTNDKGVKKMAEYCDLCCVTS